MLKLNIEPTQVLCNVICNLLLMLEEIKSKSEKQFYETSWQVSLESNMRNNINGWDTFSKY